MTAITSAVAVPAHHEGAVFGAEEFEGGVNDTRDAVTVNSTRIVRVFDVACE